MHRLSASIFRRSYLSKIVQKGRSIYTNQRVLRLSSRRSVLMGLIPVVPLALSPLQQEDATCDRCHLPLSPDQVDQIVKGSSVSLVTILNSLVRVVQDLVRALFLLCIFSPVLLTLPLIVWMNSDPKEEKEIKKYHLGNSIRADPSPGIGATFQRMWSTYLLWAMRTSGPCFVKLGQWVATRPDLFSPSICNVLSQMQTKAPMHSWENTRRLIEEENGKVTEVERWGWADVMIPTSTDGSSAPLQGRISKYPIASGAIAQVHVLECLPDSEPNAQYEKETASQVDKDDWRSFLRFPSFEVSSGEKNIKTYAVKIRHPNVQATVTRDLRLLRSIVRASVTLFPHLKWMGLTEAVDAFTKSMSSQVDLKCEAVHLSMFADNFKDVKNVRFPIPYYSSSKILVESYERGDHLYEYLKLDNRGGKGSPVLRERLAYLCLQMFIKMIFVDNLIHADLHPGNILVRRDQTGEPEIIVLDAGLVATLTPEDRRNLIDLFIAVSQGNGRLGAQLMMDRSRNKRGRKKIYCHCNDPSEIEEQEVNYEEEKERKTRFEEGMNGIFERITSVPLQEVEVGYALKEILDMCREGHVRIEGEFAALVAATIVCEGTSRQFDSDIHIIEEIQPLLGKDRMAIKAYMDYKFNQFYNWSKFRAKKDV